MKKYIMFFISIGLLLGIVLFYNTMNVEQSKKVTFSESGYILNSSTDRYYFYQDETYTTSYNNKIVFYDTEGTKVTLDNDNFIHYSNGNIVGLQKGVLLELSRIDDNPIIYYNVNANKEIKKVSNRYIVKNLDKDLQFEQAIWKISATKYIILGNNIKIKLENGTEKDVKDYVEIEYSDNEIINIYNQEISYQTISSDSYIELGKDIKINLGTKIVSKKDENKMSLEDMVINSDDNVTLVDLNAYKEENVVDENNTTENNTEENSVIIQSGTNSNTTNNSNSTTINPGNGALQEGTGEGTKDENTIEIDTPEIKYDKSDGNEIEIDFSKVLEEPKFKLENMEITALSVEGTIKITDDNDLLSKDDDIEIKIINNSTGKTVYNDSVEYGTLSIPVTVETLLPNTQYTLVVSATYVVNEVAYTKNFIYKTFVTSKIGIDIEKNGYTDESLNFTITFSDELIKGAKVTILDENGNALINREKTIDNMGEESQEIYFDGLQSNTQYKIKIYDIQYNGATQKGSNWVIYYDDCKTLKSKPSIDLLNYTIDKRNGNFKLIIDKVTDENNSIQNYKYIVYEYKKIIDAEGKETLVYDTDNIVYTRETTDKEISVDVNSDENAEGIVRETYYGFQVIANGHDNEKYVEIASNVCGPFILSGKSFPTVKFIQKEITATKIEGTLYISDADDTVVINEQNPLSVMYKNDVGDEKTFVTINNPNTVSIEDDENGEKVLAIPVELDKLKAETSYVFSTYGSIDLEDGNVYSNIFIGSAIVNTNSYKELKANLSISDSNNEIAKNSTFAIDVSLEGEKFEKESLESITFIMQPGSDFKPTDKYWSLEINNTNCASFAKDEKTVENLQDLLCDKNVLTITPSMIGGGKEADYTELNYVILATITVDGTKYPNKIPIYTEENEQNQTGNTTFTDINEKEYTAAFIIAKGKGTVANIPTSTEQAVKVTAITNSIASSYQMYDDKLNDNTIVGYQVKANFNNNGTRPADSITYYVWDKDGEPIYDGKGKQLTYTAKFTSNKNTPVALFKVNYGTIETIQEDNKKGLFRGGSYYFSYTITYIDDNGKEEIWPTMIDPNMDEKSIKSDVQSPKKQEPSFVMYPKTSNEDSITYVYSCYDYDKALNYDYTDKTKSSLELSTGGTNQGDYQIKTGVKNEEIIFKSLEKGVNYTIRYKRILNKSETTTYVAQTLVTQRFDGITNLKNVTYTVDYNNEEYPNRLRVELSGTASNLERIAGAKVTLTLDKNKWTTSLLKLEYDSNNNKYYLDVDLLSLSLNSSIINKQIDVSVKLYYDNDKIGFVPDEGAEYAAFVNTSDDYRYMTIDQDGNFVVDENYSINGNAYKYILDTQTSDELAYLKITDIKGRTKTLELKYTDKGFVYGEDIIVQKYITGEEIDTSREHKITINSIIAGIKVEEIETTITKATIKAQIINPLNLNIENNKIYIELFESDKKDEKADWEKAEIREVAVDQIGKITLDKLNPAKYYKIRFKYILDDNDENTDNTEYYMYDAETYTLKKEYSFETIATIGIENVDIQFEAINYKEKYLTITYKVDSKRSNMYEKTKYEFYEYDKEAKEYVLLNLNDTNIWENTDSGNTYKVLNGALYVNNSIYGNETKTFSNVLEKINISAENNIFTFGKNYKLVITPIVESEGTEIEIENVEKEKELARPKAPSIGIKMIREDSNGNKYIRAAITVDDNDKVMVGTTYGEYTLKVYRYKSEDKNNKEQVQIFDSPNNGTNITQQTFNLNQNGTNFSIYLQDVDFTYDYALEMHFKLDIENKNISEDKVETRIVQAIDNEAGVVLGSTNVEGNGNKIDVIFYNAYEIADINYIDYTVYNNNNNLQQVGTFEPTAGDWEQHTETELTEYHKITLPVELVHNGTYIITLNFYKIEDGQKLFAGTKEMNYTFTSGK